jgi:diacylglycerol kinase (ATP)
MTQAFLAIINPAAGGGRCAALAPAAIARLRGLGVSVESVHTRAPGDAKQRAREAFARGVRGFLSVGGDGTAHEIVNGLLPQALSAQPGDRPVLGFLPLGTGNSFVRDFSADGLAHTVEALRCGRRRSCDVLRLVHDSGELYSINLLSAGFVADVATVANRRFKRFGAAGYALSVLSQTAALTARPLRMQFDGGRCFFDDTTFVSFNNSRYTAGGMMMAPAADTADGEMDVIIAKRMSRLQLLLAFPRIFSGTHVRLPIIESVRAKRIEIRAPGPIDLMIDGEVERLTPVLLEVLPGAIDVSV